MNLFFLHRDVSQSARCYFNRHCVKIILEITQMLYTAQWMCNISDYWILLHSNTLQLDPYRKTHYNHPTTRWIRQHANNYKYACDMALALCHEYTRRYNKVHKCQVRIEWLISHPPDKYDSSPIKAYLATTNLPTGCTAIPLAMPDRYHTCDPFLSYRMYYIYDKQSIAQSQDVWIQLAQEWCIAVPI